MPHKIRLYIYTSILVAVSACGRAAKKDDAAAIPSATFASLEDIKQLKDSRAETIDALLASAEAMEFPIFAPLNSTVLATDECLALKAQMIAAHPGIDIFNQTLENGEISFTVCKALKPKLSIGTFITANGKSATRLLQEESGGYGTTTMQSMLLTDDDLIQQISFSTTYWTGSASGRQVDNGVEVLTADGDFLRKVTTYNLESSERTVLGPETHLTVATSNGDIPVVDKIVHSNTADDTKSVTQIFYYLATANDWTARFLPLTYGWNGGLYQYEESMASRPHHYVFLRTTHRAGTEVCVDGYVHDDQHSQFYPAALDAGCGSFKF